MAITIQKAESQAIREEIFRFRYGVHCVELEKRGHGIDHDKRMVVDEEDDHAIILYAEENGHMVGTVRSSFPSIAPLPERVCDTFNIAPLLEQLDGCISVTSRFMILPSYRGRTLASLLAKSIFQIGLEMNTQVAFCLSEVSLLPFYYRLGYRRYMRCLHPENAGLRIPLLITACDSSYLTSIRSPFKKFVTSHQDDHGLSAQTCKGVYPEFQEHPPLFRGELRTLWAKLTYAGSEYKRNKTTLFDQIDADWQEKILRGAVSVAFKTGEKIYLRHEKQTLGIIASGMVGIGVDTGQAEHHWIEILREGDLFGHPIPTAQDKITDFVALQETRAVFLPGDFISRLSSIDPAICNQISQNLLIILTSRLNEFHKVAALWHQSRSFDVQMLPPE